jgi:hypothetical protein
VVSKACWRQQRPSEETVRLGYAFTSSYVLSMPYPPGFSRGSRRNRSLSLLSCPSPSHFRGASVNGHKGNTYFRSMCFSRKAEFESGSHAVKRRLATEIVNNVKSKGGRFLKRKTDKGPWFEVTTEKAVLKAMQVMRDYQRPDRMALRQMQAATGQRRRQRTQESTPGVNADAVSVYPIFSCYRL